MFVGDCCSVGEKAYIYVSDNEDDEEDRRSECGSDENRKKATWRGLKMPLQHSDYFEESSESDAESSNRSSPIQDDTKLFYNEVVDSLLRGYEDKLPCDNLVLEVNSSRYAYNVTVNEVNYFVVQAVLTLKDDYSWDALSAKLKYFMPLLVNYMRNESAMDDCLQAIENTASTHPQLSPLVMKLLHLLYNKDILSEESILSWFKNPADDYNSEIRGKVKPFIEWLEKEEESESESD